MSCYGLILPINFAGGPPHEWGLPDGDATQPDLLHPGHGRRHGRHDRLDSKAWALWLLYLGAGISTFHVNNSSHELIFGLKHCKNCKFSSMLLGMLGLLFSVVRNSTMHYALWS